MSAICASVIALQTRAALTQLRVAGTQSCSLFFDDCHTRAMLGPPHRERHAPPFLTLVAVFAFSRSLAVVFESVAGVDALLADPPQVGGGLKPGTHTAVLLRFRCRSAKG